MCLNIFYILEIKGFQKNNANTVSTVYPKLGSFHAVLSKTCTGRKLGRIWDAFKTLTYFSVCGYFTLGQLRSTTLSFDSLIDHARDSQAGLGAGADVPANSCLFSPHALSMRMFPSGNDSLHEVERDVKHQQFRHKKINRDEKERQLQFSA